MAIAGASATESTTDRVDSDGDEDIYGLSLSKDATAPLQQAFVRSLSSAPVRPSQGSASETPAKPLIAQSVQAKRDGENEEMTEQPSNKPKRVSFPDAAALPDSTDHEDTTSRPRSSRSPKDDGDSKSDSVGKAKRRSSSSILRMGIHRMMVAKQENFEAPFVAEELAAGRYTQFSKLKKVINTAAFEWVESFLLHDGLFALINLLKKLIETVKDVSGAVSLLQCGECIKAVLNHRYGIEYLGQPCG